MIPLKFEIYASFSLLLEGENRIKFFRDLRHFFSLESMRFSLTYTLTNRWEVEMIY